jgi:hypothetical protein
MIPRPTTRAASLGRPSAATVFTPPHNPSFLPSPQKNSPRGPAFYFLYDTARILIYRSPLEKTGLTGRFIFTGGRYFEVSGTGLGRSGSKLMGSSSSGFINRSFSMRS